MLYQVKHITQYEYAQPVSVSHHIACLLLKETSFQHVFYSKIEIYPEAIQRSFFTDYFKNELMSFSMQEPHQVLTITATHQVEVIERPKIVTPEHTTSWEQVRDQFKTYDASFSDIDLDCIQYIYHSPYVYYETQENYRAIRQYALESFTPRRPILLASLDLMHRVYRDFKFDPTATTVATPLSVIMRERRGVCQDFAHLSIACLRALKLPARYVSGYLLTMPPPGQPRLVGADMSHAWLQVYCPPYGWVDFDPTNDMIPATDHITVAYGRDYGDISPVKGVILGGGAQHQLKVSVDVMPLEHREVA